MGNSANVLLFIAKHVYTCDNDEWCRLRFFIGVAQDYLETVFVRRHAQDNKVNRQWPHNYFRDLHRKCYGRGALIRLRHAERKRYT